MKEKGDSHYGAITIERKLEKASVKKWTLLIWEVAGQTCITLYNCID